MPNLEPVYRELRALMEPYAAQLQATQDDDRALYLNTAHLQKNKTPLFFGAVQVKKAYVAYHLMPVLPEPARLDDLSPRFAPACRANPASTSR